MNSTQIESRAVPATMVNARIARLAEQVDVNFGALSTYRPLVGGEGVPVFTGVQTCAPGYRTRMHWHPYVELLFVIEGEALVYLEGREDEIQHLGPGDIVALPPHIPHVFGTSGEQPLRILGIHTQADRIVNFTDGTRTAAHGFATTDPDTGLPPAGRPQAY